MNSLKLADDVGHYFVSADVAVGVEFLAGAAFENSMKAAYKAFVYWVVYMISGPIERIEVVRCFGDIVCSDFIVDVVGEQGTRVEQLRGLFW